MNKAIFLDRDGTINEEINIFILTFRILLKNFGP